jgi:TPR repeat protein
MRSLTATLVCALVCLGSPLAQAKGESQLPIPNACDRLAAHPLDTARVSAGVEDAELIPRLAVAACEQAVIAAPTSPRLHFQLGRALLANNQVSQARVAFEKGARSGHGASLAYLGEIYQFGLGVEADGPRARNYYEQALNNGFSFAETLLEEVTFDADDYTQADLMTMLFTGAGRSTDADDYTRNAAFSLAEQLMDGCGVFLTPKAVVNLYDYRYPKGWSPDVEALDLRLMKTTALAESDASQCQ